MLESWRAQTSDEICCSLGVQADPAFQDPTVRVNFIFFKIHATTFRCFSTVRFQE
jgi:hypothetical protein